MLGLKITMISKELAETISQKIGNIDAPSLIKKLNSLGVGNDIKLIEDSLSIPKSAITDVSSLQAELSSLSKVGRLFEATEDGDRLLINIVKVKPTHLILKLKPSPLLHFSPTFDRKESVWLGINEEHVKLPSISQNSKVLDVGAGTGFISEKIKDTFKCEVYALEPSFESAIAYENCVKRLGKDHVEKLTLQEALKNNPEKYIQAFDFVLVFKYNVPYLEKEEFIHGLSKAVKPGGTIYITSVERDRFYYNPDFGDALYLTDTMRKYFADVTISEYNLLEGSYGLMTCKKPKPLLQSKNNSQKKS